MTSDERLRAAHAEAVAARGTPTRAACVSPEALLALARREGREANRLATLDHAMACPSCRQELELLRAIEAAGNAGTRDAVEGIRWRRYASVALAASAVLAIALGPGRRLVGGGGDDTMRGGVEEVTPIAPARDAVARGSEITFTWRSVPGAQRYTLEVLTSAGVVALTRATTDTAVIVGPAQPLAPGEYRWWVRAQAGDGSERRSGARRLRVSE